MVPPFLSPIFLLWTLFPSSLGSTKRFPKLHLLFYFFCVLSVTFPAWISAARLILFILRLSACFFFILNLSAMSSGSRSWMSNRHVSRWMIWTYLSSSNVLGRVKKLLESNMSSPSKLSMIWGIRHFLERVFMAGGVITISAIGIKSNPAGRSVYRWLWDIDHILSEALTVLDQGHLVTGFG